MMARAFANISFTESVKKVQTHYGSREANAGFERGEVEGNVLTLREAEFIGLRDSFYQATVSETGWPYVQHRGGPAGFVKVIDESTIGYADFRGNRQYVSVGNLNANNQISMILMDYPNRKRLKIWGKVEIVHADEFPDIVAQLEMPGYRARVERGILIRVEAWDWNCPQHITPRYSEAEIAETGVAEKINALQEEIAALKQQLSYYGERP